HKAPRRKGLAPAAEGVQGEFHGARRRSQGRHAWLLLVQWPCGYVTREKGPKGWTGSGLGRRGNMAPGQVIGMKSGRSFADLQRGGRGGGRPPGCAPGSGRREGSDGGAGPGPIGCSRGGPGGVAQPPGWALVAAKGCSRVVWVQTFR